MVKNQTLLAALFIVPLAGFLAFYVSGLNEYFTLEAFKSQQAVIDAYYAAHPWLTALVYSLIYIPFAVLSLPGAALMTLAAGAIFGTLWGTVLISFASTIGATLEFLAARFLLRDMVHRGFGDGLKSVNEGFERDGALYLFTLRLSPMVPFFVVNLVMGLTTIPTSTYVVVSQVGMLASTVILVSIGTDLAKLESIRGLLSPGLMASLTLLGFLPLIAKKLVELLKARRRLGKFTKPSA